MLNVLYSESASGSMQIILFFLYLQGVSEIPEAFFFCRYQNVQPVPVSPFVSGQS